MYSVLLLELEFEVVVRTVLWQKGALANLVILVVGAGIMSCMVGAIMVVTIVRWII